MNSLRGGPHLHRLNEAGRLLYLASQLLSSAAKVAYASWQPIYVGGYQAPGISYMLLLRVEATE